MMEEMQEARPKMLASVAALMACAAKGIHAGTTSDQLMEDYNFSPDEAALVRRAALLAQEEPDPANVGVMARYVEQAKSPVA